jgi:hypothetical protein
VRELRLLFACPLRAVSANSGSVSGQSNALTCGKQVRASWVKHSSRSELSCFGVPAVTPLKYNYWDAPPHGGLGARCTQ